MDPEESSDESSDPDIGNMVLEATPPQRIISKDGGPANNRATPGITPLEQKEDDRKVIELSSSSDAEEPDTAHMMSSIDRSVTATAPGADADSDGGDGEEEEVESNAESSVDSDPDISSMLSHDPNSETVGSDNSKQTIESVSNDENLDQSMSHDPNVEQFDVMDDSQQFGAAPTDDVHLDVEDTQGMDSDHDADGMEVDDENEDDDSRYDDEGQEHSSGDANAFVADSDSNSQTDNDCISRAQSASEQTENDVSLAPIPLDTGVAAADSEPVQAGVRETESLSQTATRACEHKEQSEPDVYGMEEEYDTPECSEDSMDQQMLSMDEPISSINNSQSSMCPPNTITNQSKPSMDPPNSSINQSTSSMDPASSVQKGKEFTWDSNLSQTTTFDIHSPPIVTPRCFDMNLKYSYKFCIQHWDDSQQLIPSKLEPSMARKVSVCLRRKEGNKSSTVFAQYLDAIHLLRDVRSLISAFHKAGGHKIPMNWAMTINELLSLSPTTYTVNVDTQGLSALSMMYKNLLQDIQRGCPFTSMRRTGMNFERDFKAQFWIPPTQYGMRFKYITRGNQSDLNEFTKQCQMATMALLMKTLMLFTPGSEVEISDTNVLWRSSLTATWINLSALYILSNSTWTLLIQWLENREMTYVLTSLPAIMMAILSLYYPDAPLNKMGKKWTALYNDCFEYITPLQYAVTNNSKWKEMSRVMLTQSHQAAKAIYEQSQAQTMMETRYANKRAKRSRNMLQNRDGDAESVTTHAPSSLSSSSMSASSLSSLEEQFSNVQLQESESLYGCVSEPDEHVFGSVLDLHYHLQELMRRFQTDMNFGDSFPKQHIVRILSNVLLHFADTLDQWWIYPIIAQKIGQWRMWLQEITVDQQRPTSKEIDVTIKLLASVWLPQHLAKVHSWSTTQNTYPSATLRQNFDLFWNALEAVDLSSFAEFFEYATLAPHFRGTDFASFVRNIPFLGGHLNRYMFSAWCVTESTLITLPLKQKTGLLYHPLRNLDERQRLKSKIIRTFVTGLTVVVLAVLQKPELMERKDIVDKVRRELQQWKIESLAEWDTSFDPPATKKLRCTGPEMVMSSSASTPIRATKGANPSALSMGHTDSKLLSTTKSMESEVLMDQTIGSPRAKKKVSPSVLPMAQSIGSPRAKKKASPSALPMNETIGSRRANEQSIWSPSLCNTNSMDMMNLDDTPTNSRDISTNTNSRDISTNTNSSTASTNTGISTSSMPIPAMGATPPIASDNLSHLWAKRRTTTPLSMQRHPWLSKPSQIKSKWKRKRNLETAESEASRITSIDDILPLRDFDGGSISTLFEAAGLSLFDATHSNDQRNSFEFSISFMRFINPAEKKRLSMVIDQVKQRFKKQKRAPQKKSRLEPGRGGRIVSQFNLLMWAYGLRLHLASLTNSRNIDVDIHTKGINVDFKCIGPVSCYSGNWTGSKIDWSARSEKNKGDLGCSIDSISSGWGHIYVNEVAEAIQEKYDLQNVCYRPMQDANIPRAMLLTPFVCEKCMTDPKWHGQCIYCACWTLKNGSAKQTSSKRQAPSHENVHMWVHEKSTKASKSEKGPAELCVFGNLFKRLKHQKGIEMDELDRISIDVLEDLLSEFVQSYLWHQDMFMGPMHPLERKDGGSTHWNGIKSALVSSDELDHCFSGDPNNRLIDSILNWIEKNHFGQSQEKVGDFFVECPDGTVPREVQERRRVARKWENVHAPVKWGMNREMTLRFVCDYTCVGFLDDIMRIRSKLGLYDSSYDPFPELTSGILSGYLLKTTHLIDEMSSDEMSSDGESWTVEGCAEVEPGMDVEDRWDGDDLHTLLFNRQMENEDLKRDLLYLMDLMNKSPEQATVPWIAYGAHINEAEGSKNWKPLISRFHAAKQVDAKNITTAMDSRCYNGVISM